MMIQKMIVLTAVPLLLVGCASTRTPGIVDGSVPEPSVSEAAATSPATIELAALSTETAEPEPAAPVIDPALGLWSAEAGALHQSRFTVKAGYYGSNEDELDDGYIINLSWMNFFTRVFALEFEAGYFDTDGSEGGVDTDVWGIPLMLNGRFNVPLWILEVYGGLGAGTIYYDAEASGALSDSDDGFLLAGNAFLGASFTLGEAMALGLEAKYYVTDEISDLDTGLDAYAVMLTLGWSR